MTNKFRLGEIVLINEIGNISDRKIKTFGIIQCKDYYFNQYLVYVISSNTEEWFKEKDIEKVMEESNKKLEKYKVALAIDVRGLNLIKEEINKIHKYHNNILKKVDIHYEYSACKKDYAIFIWTSTYWTENNYVVKCIEDTLKKLRIMDIAYKRIIVGITDPTYIKINEFIENDKNVDVFNIFQRIEVKKIGGILT